MTSETILDVAIRQFGDRGFEGASTRAIAAAANTVMSSITYHFGGKEGLYLACADHIAVQIRERFRPVTDAIVPLETIDQKQAIDAIITIIDRIAQLMMSDESRDWASFIIREQQNPGPAFDRLYQGFMVRMEEVLLALIMRARPDMDERSARALGISLFGQALVLRGARAAVIHILKVNEIGEPERALMLARIRYNIEAIMRSDSPS